MLEHVTTLFCRGHQKFQPFADLPLPGELAEHWRSQRDFEGGIGFRRFHGRSGGKFDSIERKITHDAILGNVEALKRWDSVRAVIPGSARVSRVGFGVSPKQSSGEVRDLEDAMAITRNARAMRNSPCRAAHEIFFVNTSSVPRCRKI